MIGAGRADFQGFGRFGHPQKASGRKSLLFVNKKKQKNFFHWSGFDPRSLVLQRGGFLASPLGRTDGSQGGEAK
jgi:hypothetical protein